MQESKSQRYRHAERLSTKVCARVVATETGLSHETEGCTDTCSMLLLQDRSAEQTSMISHTRHAQWFEVCRPLGKPKTSMHLQIQTSIKPGRNATNHNASSQHSSQQQVQVDCDLQLEKLAQTCKRWTGRWQSTRPAAALTPSERLLCRRSRGCNLDHLACSYTARPPL